MNFNIRDPLAGAELPAWLKDKYRASFSYALNGLKSGTSGLFWKTEQVMLETAEKALASFFSAIESAVLAAGQGCYEVKVHAGKTGASKSVSMPVHKGAEEGEEGTSTFFVPTASLVNGHFLPAWLAKKKLAELAERGLYKSQRYERIPACPLVWPDKESYIAEVRAAVLPVLLQERKRIAEREAVAKIEDQKRKEQEERQAAERAAEAERMRPILEKKAAAAERAKQKRIAAMETHQGVKAEWTSWYKSKGSFYSSENCIENATVRISGARAYIIEPSGKEHIVATKNLKFQAVAPTSQNQ